MSKLNLHWQNTANWMHRVEFSAPYVKLMDPPENNIFPGKMTIGRVYMSDGEEGAYYTRGHAGGAAYFERCLSWYKRAPYIHAWECFNEPAVIKTTTERDALDGATVEWCHMMHACGLKCVVGNFSERNPPEGTISDFWRMLSTADYLGLHMYGAPSMHTESEGHALRYRQLEAEISEADIGAPMPPILIGECGIDLGIIGRGRKGWQKMPGLDWGEYRDELVWYDSELAKDPYIYGAFMFTAAPSKDWRTFGITEKQARDLARRLR